jgi:hypothetical protein
MASVILKQNYAAVSDVAISTTVGSWARPFNPPAGWNTLRLGVRYHITDIGGTVTSTPRLGIALCSGTINLMGDATTTNAIGVISTSATWGRGGVGYAPIAFSAMTYVGTTISTTTTFNTAVPYLNTTTPCRQLFIVNIAKGSPNYTVTVTWWNPGGGPFGDVSSALLMNSMLGPFVVPTSVTNYAVDTPRALAFDEANGTLNAVNVWWNHSDVACVVTDVAVAVIA